MPGQHTYRFLPLSHKPTAGAMGALKHKKDPYEVSYSPRDSNNPKDPPVELSGLPQRSPSRIAADVVDNSIYRHKKEEKLQRARRKRLVLVGVAVGVFLLLAVVVIAVAVALTRGGGPEEVRAGLYGAPGVGAEIRFNRSDPSTYEPMVEAIEEFLNDYRKTNMSARGGCRETEPPEATTTTTPTPKPAPTPTPKPAPLEASDAPDPAPTTTTTPTTTTPDPTTPCTPSARPYKVSFLDSTECTKANSFGYQAGMPCVPLVLRVPQDWDARACVNVKVNANVDADVDVDANSDANADMDANTTTTSTTTTTTTLGPPPVHVKVTCTQKVTGTGNQTQEEITLKVLPVTGFPASALEDRDLPRYMDPLVMVQVTDAGTPGQEVEFTCSVCPGFSTKEEYSKHFRLKVD